MNSSADNKDTDQQQVHTAQNGVRRQSAPVQWTKYLAVGGVILVFDRLITAFLK